MNFGQKPLKKKKREGKSLKDPFPCYFGEFSSYRMDLYLKAFDQSSFERVRDRLHLEEEPDWATLFSFQIKEVEFIECLGCGAYAEVWLCYYKITKELVALKIEGIPDQKGELQGLSLYF